MDTNSIALRTHLRAFVPLQVALLERSGGITDEDIEWAKQQIEVIAYETDVLFNGRSKPGQTARIAGVLTKVLAIMSFSPSGKRRVEEWGRVMAQYTKAIAITFNNNDGGLSWAANPECAVDVQRHYKIYGKWRSRLMFLRAFWKGLRLLESHGKERA